MQWLRKLLRELTGLYAELGRLWRGEGVCATLPTEGGVSVSTGSFGGVACGDAAAAKPGVKSLT